MADDNIAAPKRPENPPSPTLRDLLVVLFRQRWVAVATFGTVFAAIGIYAAFTPTYQAHMKILLRRGRVDPMISPAQNSQVELARSAITEEELNSEVELLRDEDLLRKVVEQGGLAQGAIPNETNRNIDEVEAARAIRALSVRLKVEPIRRSNLIQVSYAAAEPRSASGTLSRLAKVYVERHKELRRWPDETTFFEQQARLSRERLEEAESRILNFSRDGGVVSGVLERDLALQRQAQIESDDQRVRVSIQETTRRVQALQSQLNAFPQRSTSLIRTSDNTQLLENLKSKLLELELKRTELLTKFQPSYRLVEEVQQQIDQARSAIAAERLAPVRDETTEKDPNYEWAKAELEKAEVDLSALQQRKLAIWSELQASRLNARHLGEQSIQQQNLLRSMKTAEESYLLYARKSEEARIGDALDQRGILNVIIAEPPVVPALPQHSGWFWIVVSSGIAAAAAFGMAFTVDYLDPAFRTPEEVVACLHTPVLASLPREAA